MHRTRIVADGAPGSGEESRELIEIRGRGEPRTGHSGRDFPCELLLARSPGDDHGAPDLGDHPAYEREQPGGDAPPPEPSARHQNGVRTGSNAVEEGLP